MTAAPLFRTAHATQPMRILAIAIVFALGASLVAPTPVAAQVAATLSGTISDADGGALADAQVIAKKRMNGSLYEYHEATTAEDGSYNLSGLTTGTWDITVRRDGYRTNTTTLELALGQAATHSLALASMQSSFFRGTVLDGQDQSPIGGALITVHPGDGSSARETTSADDGTFTIKLFNQENRITISKSGYGTQHDWAYSPMGDVERTIWLYEVPPQSATVTGRVIDAATGAPIQAYIDLNTDWSNGGCCVSYAEPQADMMAPSYIPHHGNYNSTVTAADGTFTMRAYPGDVVVSANRATYLVATHRVTLTADGTTTLTFELAKLPERTVTVSGTIKDRATGDPLHGAAISVQVPGAGDYQWATADEDGTFRVQVRPGYTLVEVNYWGYDWGYGYTPVEETSVSNDGNSSSTSGSSSIAPPPSNPKQYYPTYQVFTTTADEQRDIQVSLQPKPEPTGVLIGYVIDATTDTAVSGARVSLHNHATGDWGQAVTDGNGSYRFRANGGYHSVRVDAPGYLPFAANVVVDGDGATRADFAVQPGEHANEGWWSPDQGDEGRHYPGAPSLYETSASTGQDGDMESASADKAVGGASGSGSTNIVGSGGGLPAYDPSSAGQTFGEGKEAPAPAPLALVLALAALALVAGLRRRRAA